MLRSLLRFRLLPLSLSRLLLLSAVSTIPLPHGFHHLVAAQPAQGEKRTAPALLAEIERGVAAIGKGAKKAKLDPKATAAAPFFAALGKVARNTATMKKQLAAKDRAYFRTLSDTAKLVGELRIAAPRIGVKNVEINAGTALVFQSFDALRRNFGMEATRNRTGGGLTSAEAPTLEKIQTRQRAIAAKVKPLQEKAAREGNRQLASDLGGLLAQSLAIANAQAELTAFLEVLEVVEVLGGQYDSYVYYLPASYRTDWEWIETTVAESYTESWEVYESYEVSEWAYYETYEVETAFEDSVAVSLTEEEVSEYYEEIEETDVEVSEETFIDPEDYEESLEANEEEQDDTWADIEEEEAMDEDDKSYDEEEEAMDEGDESYDEEEEAMDENDESYDEEEEAMDEGDESYDEEEEAMDEDDESYDEEEEAMDEDDESYDEEEEAMDEDDESYDEEEGAMDEGDESYDEEEESMDEGDESYDEEEESMDEGDESYDEEEESYDDGGEEEE